MTAPRQSLRRSGQLVIAGNSRLLPGAAIYGPRCGVRGMTIWPDPERCQMKSRRGTGAYFGVAELVFGSA
jgi:hypothetical protein